MMLAKNIVENDHHGLTHRSARIHHHGKTGLYSFVLFTVPMRFPLLQFLFVYGVCFVNVFFFLISLICAS